MERHVFECESREKRENMNESFFRNKSLDRISSPEEIDDCMKVTRPSMWLVLGAILLLLLALNL